MIDRFALITIAAVLLALTFALSVAVHRLHRQEAQAVHFYIGGAPVPPQR